MRVMTETARVEIVARESSKKVDLREVASAVLRKADESDAAQFLESVGARRPSTTGARVRMWRKVQGLSLRELSERSGLAYQNLSSIERGRRPVGLAVARKLAKGLRIDYRRLV